MALSSYLSSKCEVRKKSFIHGVGMFAKEEIQGGELLAIWGGHILTPKDVAQLPKELRERDHPIQIYEDLYFGPKEIEEVNEAEFFNHSCSPNAGIKGQILIVARRDIQESEEICIDYETADSKGIKSFLCRCGSAECRKNITGEAWKDPAFQKKNEGFFSWYLQEKITMRNQLKLIE